MDLEDQYRFAVEAAYSDYRTIHAWIGLSCDRCGWQVEITDPISLADLNGRADEHTEVCR